MQGHRVRTCWGRDTEAGFSDLHLLSISIAPRLLKGLGRTWGPGGGHRALGSHSSFTAGSQLVHPVFSGCIQQLPSDGCSPAKEIATWSLWGLSPWWTLPPPKPPTWGPLWLLLLFRLLDSCPEPQSMGHDILNDSYSLFVHWPSDRTCSQMVSEQGGGKGTQHWLLQQGADVFHPRDWSWALSAHVPDGMSFLPWVPTRVTAPGIGNLISPA